MERQRKDCSAEYSNVVLGPLLEETRASRLGIHLHTFVKVVQILKDVSRTTSANHSQLRLDNPAWANALKLIELSGSSLDPDTVKKINASFAGDRSALRVLRDLYKSHGVVYNGGLDEQIYDPESGFQRLVEHSYSALIREGSLNTLATAISRVAALEGIEFPKMVDEQAAEEVMRRAAGLPPE